MTKKELLTHYEQDARTKEIVSLSLEPKTKLFLVLQKNIIMKSIYTILFILLMNSSFSQSAINWGKVYDRSDSPTRRDFITSTEDKYFFTTMVRMPNIQDILIYDNENNLIGKKKYHKMHVIKHIIEFDENHIYLVSLKKEKGIFKYYASRFDAKTGDFGDLFLIDEIEEKIGSIKLFASYKVIDKDLAGWAMSPDKEKLIFIHSVGSTNESGNLNIRISYFNNKLKKTDTKIIETNVENSKNDIKDFILLNNNSVVVLVKQFKNSKNALKENNDVLDRRFQTPVGEIQKGRRVFVNKHNLIFIDSEGKQFKKTFEASSFNQVIKNYQNGFYLITNSQKELKILNFDENFNLVFKTSENIDEQNSTLSVFIIDNETFIIFKQYYYEIYNSTDSDGNSYSYSKRKYSGFKVLKFIEEEKLFDRTISAEYEIEIVIMNNQLYCSFYEYDDNRVNVRVLKLNDFTGTVIQTKKIDDTYMSSFFWNLNDEKLLFEIKKGDGSYQLGKKKDEYQFGSIRLSDLSLSILK